MANPECEQTVKEVNNDSGSKVDEQNRPSIRFELSLTELQDQKFPSFSYAQLVRDINFNKGGESRKKVECLVNNGNNEVIDSQTENPSGDIETQLCANFARVFPSTSAEDGLYL
ncbi:hypothetical protein QAD02_019026 [Eretmocerus hayati]|uniref:Uncharacterized protein n=1 Tax=Eretmocerus hayati TaxID=131215 RepID=A0ACC2PIV6_9HYME|nr:hypothetical protein QAD02_019026 [Eretmocerus hayati]